MQATFLQLLVKFVAHTSMYDKLKLCELRELVTEGSVDFHRLKGWQKSDEKLGYGPFV